MRRATTVQRSVALIATMLTLFVFLSTGFAQACPSDNNPTMLPEQHAAQVFAKPSAATGAVGKSAIENGSARGLVAIFYESRCWGHTSCRGSSALIFVESCVPFLVDVQRANFPLLQTDLASNKLDTQFRPPRLVF